MSPSANVLSVAPPIRLGVRKFWNDFDNDSMGYYCDIWIDEINNDDAERITTFFDNLSDSFLKQQLELMHVQARDQGLSDEWLGETELGVRLAGIRFRIASVVERFHHLDALTARIYMKCSLFIIAIRNRNNIR